MEESHNVLKRKLERERQARKKAEEILETKSLELYEAVLQTQSLADSLEKKVHERTKELEQARDQALKSNKAKGEFLANITHEIRTPLNGILGVLELLCLETMSDKQTEYLEAALQSAELLKSLVNDVLDFSKIDAKKLYLEKIPFNLILLLKNLIKPFRIEAIKKNITLTLNFEPSVDEVLYGDPVRVQQIVSNLMGNALKFTNQGAIMLDVFLDDQARVVISVKDQGIGIPQESLKKIFDHFTQADMSIAREYGGTGLGLSICKKLTEMMGGVIDVQSTVGEGTAFYVHLPLSSGERVQVSIEVKPKEKPIPSDVYVLVVDDNDVNLMVASAMLDALGVTCKKASSGAIAIELVKEHSFDLIFMDLNMPIMDGIRTTQMIKELEACNSATPIIALTAQTIEVGSESESGFDDHALKPVDKDTFEKLIHKWVVLKT
jgi:signal transduction histidine kinase/CheY-like chemotaxis protein